MFPSIFISHGSPMLGLTESPARSFLMGLGKQLGRPRAILVASAHWETPTATLNAVAVNDTIHDFSGFPPELYAMRYPAPGAPELAEQASDLLCAAGLASRIDRARGLDHGAWVPLALMYPEADIPVLQVSLQGRLGPAHHFQLGRALAPLREQDVLVIGSGSFTHDLSRIRRGGLDDPEPPDVVDVRQLVRRGDHRGPHLRPADLPHPRAARRPEPSHGGTSAAVARRDGRRRPGRARRAAAFERHVQRVADGRLRIPLRARAAAAGVCAGLPRCYSRSPP